MSLQSPDVQPLCRRSPTTTRSSCEVLERWEREQTFEQLRALNADGPRFSFFDGPVTANKCARGPHRLGAHAQGCLPALQGAAWATTSATRTGSTARGSGSRWGSSASSGSTRSARSRSSASRNSRAAAARRSSRPPQELTDGSNRLGQWMDWGADYYTFSDTNIEYIWRFLQLMHTNGRVYLGHRSTEWCPRCGTSLSQHELSHRASTRIGRTRRVFVRFPLARSRARVARRSGRRRHGRCRPTLRRRSIRRPSTASATTANGSRSRVYPEETSSARCAGRSSSASPTSAPSTPSGRAAGVEHRVIPWDEVSLDEGTGSSTSRRAAVARTSSCRVSMTLRCCTPVDESGHFYDTYGWLHGLSTGDSADQIIGDLRERGLLVHAGLVRASLPPLLALRHAADLSASRTTGSSRSRSSGNRCSMRTRRSSGHLRTWASAWTTGCSTWATGTSRAVGSTGSRSPSTPAPAGISTSSGRGRSSRSARSVGSTSSRSCAGRGSMR